MRISRVYATGVASIALLAAAVLATVVLTVLPGCFSPLEPACAFTCATPPHSCPTGYSCGNDGICHSDKIQGECFLAPPDAGPADVDGTGNER